jgi:hypothetical protein
MLFLLLTNQAYYAIGNFMNEAVILHWLYAIRFLNLIRVR